MNPFAKPTIYRKVPVSEEPIAATLRALTYQSRADTTPLLATTLSECGCWTRERAGSANGLYVLFELPLPIVDDLYLSLIECGLEFDRKGHCELALLCTLSRHSHRESSLRRNIALRLELTFLDELEPATYSLSPTHA